MNVIYRDNLGLVSEKVDECGISFVGTTVYFNDKQVDVTAIVQIVEEA